LATQKSNNQKLKNIINELQTKMDEQKESTKVENEQIETTINALKLNLHNLQEQYDELKIQYDYNNEKYSNSKYNEKNFIHLQLEIKELNMEIKRKDEAILLLEAEKETFNTQNEDLHIFKEENLSLINELHNELKIKNSTIQELLNKPSTSYETIILEHCSKYINVNDINKELYIEYDD